MEWTIVVAIRREPLATQDKVRRSFRQQQQQQQQHEPKEKEKEKGTRRNKATTTSRKPGGAAPHHAHHPEDLDDRRASPTVVAPSVRHVPKTATSEKHAAAGIPFFFHGILSFGLLQETDAMIQTNKGGCRSRSSRFRGSALCAASN
jgi:hypothetical protein